MGLFDTFVDENDNKGQVKIYLSALREFKIGDTVPPLDEAGGAKNLVYTYSIAMCEGGFVNIKENVYESWSKRPHYTPVLDKYGSDFSLWEDEEAEYLFPFDVPKFL